MSEILKQFFGEDGKTAIDYDTLVKGVTEKGIKLADLSLGGYVDANKYADQTRKFKELEESSKKYQDYDEIVAERNALKTEKEESEFLGKIAGKNVAEQFRRFVLAEVKGKVDEKTTFDKALETYLKENPQYVVDNKPPRIINSGLNMENKEKPNLAMNEYMNNIIRGANKK